MHTVCIEKLNSVMNSIVGFLLRGFGFVFDKVDKVGFFDFDELIVSIVKRQDKVEKVALPQIGRRLLLELASIHSHTE